MFIERTLELIKEKQISKNKLLTDLNLSKNSFVDWQNRGTIPSAETVAKIADYLDCSVDYLLGRTSNKDINPLDADFFRLLLSDKGLLAIKASLKERINAYGYEKLEQDTGLSLIDLKLFLTTDITAGTNAVAALDKILLALDTNVYDLLTEDKANTVTRNSQPLPQEELVASNGKVSKAPQPKIIPEITPPQMKNNR